MCRLPGLACAAGVELGWTSSVSWPKQNLHTPIMSSLSITVQDAPRVESTSYTTPLPSAGFDAKMRCEPSCFTKRRVSSRGFGSRNS